MTYCMDTAACVAITHAVGLACTSMVANTTAWHERCIPQGPSRHCGVRVVPHCVHVLGPP